QPRTAGAASSVATLACGPSAAASPGPIDTGSVASSSPSANGRAAKAIRSAATPTAISERVEVLAPGRAVTETTGVFGTGSSCDAGIDPSIRAGKGMVGPPRPVPGAAGSFEPGSFQRVPIQNSRPITRP